jgi:acetyl esterase/lipase
VKVPSRVGSVLALALVVVSMIAPRGSAQTSGDLISGVAYTQRAGGPLLLDAYVPAGEGPFPGVILIHGGGWKEGSRQDENKVAGFLAADGFVAFAVDYRLINVATYPGALHDVEDAVRFIRQHAKDFSLDPSKLGAMGFSAGGELAGLLGTLGHGSTSTGSRVAAVATFSGPLDLEALLEGNSPDALPLVIGYLGCEPSPACDAIAREASPIDHVDATDAPMYLVNSTAETMPLPQATSMKKALDRAGVTADLTIIPGSQHVPLSESTLAGAADFLSKTLESSTSGTSGGPKYQPTATLGPGKVAEGEGGTASARPTSSAGVEVIVASVIAAMAGVLGYVVWNRRRFRYFGPTR